MSFDFIGEERLELENDKFCLYSNDLTRDCTKKARAMDIHGMELRGWAVYKAVSKEDPDNHFYVILDENREPYHDTDSIWEMYDWIHAKKMVMQCDYDIVEMAERLKEVEE